LVTGTITEGHLALKPHLCTWRRSSLRNRRTSSVICGRAPAMHFCCRCARPIPGRRPAFVPEFLEALETNQDCNAFFETVLMSSSIWLLKNFLVVLRMCVLFRWPMRQLSLSLELDGRKNGCGKWQAGHAYVTTAPPDVSAPCGVFIDCIDWTRIFKPYHGDCVDFWRWNHFRGVSTQLQVRCHQRGLRKVHECYACWCSFWKVHAIDAVVEGYRWLPDFLCL
jgi:hypothetical protein